MINDIVQYYGLAVQIHIFVKPINSVMTTDDQFGIYDAVTRKRISYGRMSEPERFQLYNAVGVYIGYGIFSGSDIFYIYDLQGKKISYGLMDGTQEFTVYDDERNRIAYGVRE